MSASDLPIDIHSGKLLDWLVSRRHCRKDWQKNVLLIREKIKHAILDMPESQEIMQLLAGSYINYFHCVRIIELLRETEKDTKNFLGMYSSQRMKDWQEIDSLYKKDNVNLAESAQLLQRLVQYEIPALKKTIAKNDQAVVDTAKKEKDYVKQSADGKKLYEKELENMGLKGVSLRSELFSLAAELPKFFEFIVKEIQKLEPAVQYYKQFRDFIHQSKAPKVTLLPALELLMEKGLTATTYELKYGQVPTRIEAPDFEKLLSNNESSEESGDAEIDFGEDIDFGDEIDYGGIEEGVHIDVVADSCGAVDTVASGDDALSLLENTQMQKRVKAELIELQIFLTVRKEDEERETAADLYIRGAESRPPSLSKVTMNQVGEWISRIDDILTELTKPQRVHLFHIRTSPQYVEKIVSDLERTKGLEARYKRLAELMVIKQAEAQAALANAKQALTQLAENTKELQKQLEAEISKKYNGRKVNIMGGVNQALAGI